MISPKTTSITLATQLKTFIALTMQPATLVTLTATAIAIADKVAAHYGDMTYHNFAGGVDAYGHAIQDNDYTVAVNEGYFTAGGNPNTDTICGKTITITRNGKTATARVSDKCGGCSKGSINAT